MSVNSLEREFTSVATCESVKVEPKKPAKAAEVCEGKKDGCWPPDERKSFIRKKDAFRWS